ncbi:MAG TPA: type II toxin-antitoxin system VapB family antitoxin [Methylocystis sp.]
MFHGQGELSWSGRSQAVRLPKDYRIEADEVRIRRRGDTIILEPIPKNWAWLDAVAGTVSEDFLKEGRQQPPMQERTGLDEAF